MGVLEEDEGVLFMVESCEENIESNAPMLIGGGCGFGGGLLTAVAFAWFSGGAV